MKTSSISQAELLMLAGLGVAAFVAVKGIRGAAAAAGGAIVDAASGAVVGVTDAAGQAVGLPALSDITTDPGVARWILDHPKGGQFAASKWASAGAYFDAQFLDEGSGTVPPDPLSKIYKLFPPFSGVSGSW